MSKTTGPAYAGWLTVLVIAAVLRFYLWQDQLIADDEWHALHMVAGQSYWQIFSQFGIADHCIPLTLFYKAAADLGQLNEWIMRLPMLIAGLIAVVWVPKSLSRWLSPAEQLLAGALLALSPLLIYYSRTARPYALLFLLAHLAIPLAYRWWYSRDRRAGWGFAACAVSCAWLNPLSMAYTLSPVLWFGADALRQLFHRHNGEKLFRLIRLSCGITIAIAALIGAPVVNDWSALAGKAGSQTTTPETWQTFLQLFSGSGAWPVTTITGLFALAGLVVLVRRQPGFMGFWLFCAFLFVVTVTATQANWISHGLVLARYLLPTLSLVLVVAGVGLLATAKRLNIQGPWAAALSSIALLTAFSFGPIPEQYGRYNQFTGHMRYQFDYRLERSNYNVLETVEVPDAYRSIADSLGKTASTVVEVPWLFEWHFNLLYRYQDIHQMRVKAGFIEGLCGSGLRGEYAPEVTGLNLSHAIHLQSLLASPNAELVVFHHPKPGWAPADRWPNNLDTCIDAFSATFGEPWMSTPELVVFQLPSSSGAAEDQGSGR
ncbi:MAG: glycosyltransferase family 39 protein [Lysobacterales bacterium]